MSTLRRMRLISIIWGMLLVALFVVVTIFGIKYKNNTKLYQEQEKKLLDACRTYVDANKLYPVDSSLKITLSELREANYLNVVSVGSDECDGYVIVRDNDSVEYKSYIKCERYSTKGYSKNK